MSNTTTRRPGVAAPLPRAWLDTIAPALRVLFGLIFLAWSWISTILILGALLAPVLPGATTAGIPDRALVALAFAFFVSIAEFVSSDRWPAAYWIVLLILDAPFTAWQTRAWLVKIVEAQTEISLLGHAAIVIVAIVGGIIAAVFGEVLLFGRRRER